MRSTFVIAGFLALVFSGCFRAPILPPKEVLAKTFFVSSSLDSFSFSAQGSAELRGARIFSGSAVLNGAVLRTGPWSIDATIVTDTRWSQGHTRADGVIRLRAPGNGILYMDIAGLSGDSAKGMRALSGVTADGWTRLALPGNVSEKRGVPTQAEIDSQVQAIEIVEDRTEAKADVYEYVVRIPAALFSEDSTDGNNAMLLGTLWIDRNSFRLVRARWSGSKVSTSLGVITFDADVTIGSPNETRLPSMPLATGSVLPLESIFAIIL